MSIFSEYSSIVINSFLKLREGDALSVNTEEKDFELARVLADMAVRVTKTVVKIVVTVDGKPSEVVDFDPYEPAVEVKSLCMLHLNHQDDNKVDFEKALDVIVDKDDLKAIQKLGHLADPIILDRRIVITWCTVPAFYADSMELKNLVARLSDDIEGQILAVKYRQKFLNHADIDSFHFFGDNCDFTVDIPEGCFFYGGLNSLSNGREFLSSVDFQRLLCNVDKNSINGWFNTEVKVLGKVYNLKLTFEKGKLKEDFRCSQLSSLLSFDENLSKPGCVLLNDKDFRVMLGSSSVDSLSVRPDSVENLPSWFNDSIYKIECKLDEKLNIEYIDCENKAHELVRKGFFLE